MDDLIRRREAIAAIEKTKSAMSEDGEPYVAKINLQQIIALLPSAQPEIIRCKDCKHYKDAFPYNICEVHESEATDPEDFCSYGDRRDG